MAKIKWAWSRRNLTGTAFLLPFSFSVLFFLTETSKNTKCHVMKRFIVSNCFGLPVLSSAVEHYYPTDAIVTAEKQDLGEEKYYQISVSQ